MWTRLSGSGAAAASARLWLWAFVCVSISSTSIALAQGRHEPGFAARFSFATSHQTPFFFHAQSLSLALACTGSGPSTPSSSYYTLIDTVTGIANDAATAALPLSTINTVVPGVAPVIAYFETSVGLITFILPSDRFPSIKPTSLEVA